MGVVFMSSGSFLRNFEAVDLGVFSAVKKVLG